MQLIDYSSTPLANAFLLTCSRNCMAESGRSIASGCHPAESFLLNITLRWGIGGSTGRAKEICFLVFIAGNSVLSDTLTRVFSICFSVTPSKTIDIEENHKCMPSKSLFQIHSNMRKLCWIISGVTDLVWYFTFHGHFYMTRILISKYFCIIGYISSVTLKSVLIHDLMTTEHSSILKKKRTKKDRVLSSFLHMVKAYWMSLDGSGLTGS